MADGYPLKCSYCQSISSDLFSLSCTEESSRWLSHQPSYKALAESAKNDCGLCRLFHGSMERVRPTLFEHPLDCTYVVQVKGYLADSRDGHFGVLCCRSGPFKGQILMTMERCRSVFFLCSKYDQIAEM